MADRDTIYKVIKQIIAKKGVCYVEDLIKHFGYSGSASVNRIIRTNVRFWTDLQVDYVHSGKNVKTKITLRSDSEK